MSFSNMIKVTIKHQNNLLDHIVFRNVRLVTQIDMLCQLFGIQDQPKKYSLLVEELGVYLTDDALYPTSSTYIKIDNKVLELQLSTVFQVESVLETMKNCIDHKKSLVSLKSHLSKNFSGEFIKRGGLEYLQSIINESTSANTSSVAFGILETLSTCPEFSWEYISQEVIDKVVSNFGYINVNPSLKLGIKLATDMKGYAMLQYSIDKTITADTCVYRIINSNLVSKDINTQTSTLNLINNMISNSPCPIEFLNNIETYNISSTLKTQLTATDTAFRKQIYLFQCHKIQSLIMDSKTPYNKEELSHQKLLESLWSILFPNQTFHRSHENWQILGFQNKDPSSDFRGMGLAGLKHLIYLANNHKEDFETAIKKQQTENYYPYATSGIQVTQFLVECVKPINISHTSHNEVIGQIYPVLFESENALNEIYCVIMDVFSVVWKEWNVSYMSFQKVFQFVSGLASEVLPKVNTVAEFRKQIVDKIMNKKQERKQEKRSSSRISKQYNTTTTTTASSSSLQNATTPASSTSHPISSGSGSSNSLNGNNPGGNSNQNLLGSQNHSNNSLSSYNGASGGNLNYNGSNNNLISCSPCNSSISGSGSISITNSQEGGYNQSINSKTFIEDIDIDSCTGSPDGNTPLHTAIMNNSPLDWIASEININLFLNSTNNQGFTPLHLSCQISPFHIIEFLLHQDIDANLPSKKGDYPIHSFVSRKWSTPDEFLNGLQLFISKGVDINQSTSQTLDTSLHFSVYYGFDENVRCLLSLNANPNLYNKNGQTPLHLAVYRKNHSVISHLIQNNADPNLLTENTKESCEDICNGDPEILLLLNPTKLSRSTSNSSSSIISTTTTTTTTTTFKLPDEANNYYQPNNNNNLNYNIYNYNPNNNNSNNSSNSNSNNNSNNINNNNNNSNNSSSNNNNSNQINNNSSSSSTTTSVTTVKKNPLPLPKRPTPSIQINNNNISPTNGSGITNSISNSSSSSSSSSISNSNSNSNQQLVQSQHQSQQQQQHYINSQYNSNNKNSISSPNHISPSTSPSVTSPNFRSTPLKQTMSIGIMYSPTQENHHQAISTPTSPPYLSSNTYTRGNSGLFQNINGNISTIEGIGLGRNTNGHIITPSNNNTNIYNGYNRINTSPTTNTFTPTPKDQKKADAINNIRRLLNESLCLIDLVCNAPEKQKENVKKINEALKQAQSSLKTLK